MYHGVIAYNPPELLSRGSCFLLSEMLKKAIIVYWSKAGNAGLKSLSIKVLTERAAAQSLFLHPRLKLELVIYRTVRTIITFTTSRAECYFAHTRGIRLLTYQMLYHSLSILSRSLRGTKQVTPGGGSGRISVRVIPVESGLGNLVTGRRDHEAPVGLALVCGITFVDSRHDGGLGRLLRQQRHCS